MTVDAQAFVQAWLARTFAADVPWTDLYPTPLAALTELQSAAGIAGVPAEDLHMVLGDGVGAITAAMLEAPAPDPHRFASPAPDRDGARSAVAAMEMALSYGDGLRDAVGTDRSLAANLVLHYLARQGFGLRPLIDDVGARAGGTGPDLRVPV
jgi:hypothetical protein